jgi:hypothetical protein
MKSKWFLYILVTLFFIAFSVWFYGEKPSVPVELEGRWVSDHPKYKDRYLELSRVSVVYRTGLDNLDVNFVTSVEKQPHGNHYLYTIHYKSKKNGEGKISFYWDPSNTGVITLKNQDSINWTKVATES